MTTVKLTLSVSLLAASLMLAAPVKAETWSCSITNSTMYGRDPIIFKRWNDTSFTARTESKSKYWGPFKILSEDRFIIQLYYQVPSSYIKVVSLYKATNEFEFVELYNVKDPWHMYGKCVINID